MKCDGVNGVHDRKGHTAAAACNAAVIGRKRLDSALRAEEHDALIENGKPREALICRECFAAYLVKISDVHGVISAVEAYFADTDLAVQQLCFLGTHAECALYVGKRALRGVDPQILDAVLVAAGIHYLSRIYANGLFDAVAIIDRTGHDPVCHINTSQNEIEEKLQYSLCSAGENVKIM